MAVVPPQQFVDDVTHCQPPLVRIPATMARWRKRLFIATSYITADAAEFFSLPLGSRIEV